MLDATLYRTTVLHPRRALLWLLVIVPFVVGWVVGVVVRLALLLVAALVEGYTVGRRQ
jgi:hypothetical protein